MTVAVTGVDCVATIWYGVFAPAKIPKPVVQKIAKAIEAALQDAELRQRLAEQGLAGRPLLLQDFDAYFRKELEVWGSLVKAIGLKLD